MDLRIELNKLDRNQLDLLIDILNIYSSEDPEYETPEEKRGMILTESRGKEDVILEFISKLANN